MKRPPKEYCFCPERENKNINSKIIKAFGEELIKELVKNHQGITMPKPFGRILIVMYKHKPVDGPNSEKGNVVRMQNYHSDGYRAKFIEMKSSYDYRIKKYKNMAYNNIYYFKPYRRLRKALFDLMHTDDWVDHVRFDDVIEYKNFLKGI